MPELNRQFAIYLVIVFLGTALPALGQGEHTERMLPLDGDWDDESGAFRLSWEAKGALKSGTVSIDRRELSERGGAAWQPLATGLRRRRVYNDDSVAPGKAYEYRVTRTDGDAKQLGYWLAGREIPAVSNRGVAVLVVDESIEAPLAEPLRQFIKDLVGDGWRVVRHSVPRHNRDAAANLEAANALRAWVAAQRNKSPDKPHSLILFGHVPMVKSGSVGHGGQPHETDLYYANIGPRWAQKPGGTLLQSVLPGLKIHLNVGRIDFAAIAGGDRDAEIRHLSHYLEKNHARRHGELGDRRNVIPPKNNRGFE